jgi:hypothetical protein
MAIDSHYIPAFSIEDVLLDKDTGAPLSGGLVYFFEDNQRGTFKPVYQITGTYPLYTFTQLPNPMVLSSIGTFEDSLGNPVVPYFLPYDANFNPDYYYVVVTSATGVNQFVRQSVPFIPTSGTAVISSAFINELSNPQFSTVNFTSPTTYTFNAASSQVVNIAPGWDIVVSSIAGATVTLSVTTPTGSLNDITNPGSLLNINSAGTSSLLLRQRLFGSPNLWGNGFLASSFVAKTYAGTSSVLTLSYSQSNGSVINQVINSATLPGSDNYTAFPESFFIPTSNSANTFPSAYVDIFFTIPNSTEIDITSVMLAFTGAVSVNTIVYDQMTNDMQTNGLFYYYKPKLEFKPISSYLVGWDFPLNPSQEFGSSVATTAAANAYTWDQTILYQSTASKLSTSRAPNGSMVVTSADASNATQAALIQYMEQPALSNMLESRLSSNVQGDTNEVGGLVATVSLWYTTNAAVPALPLSLITTLDANGHPSAVVAGWVEIVRNNMVGNAQFTLNGNLSNFGFNGWDLTGTSIPNTAKNFAIVLGTAALTNTKSFSINSISLVPGDIPTIPAPQTFDEVLRECQYYFEKSYDNVTIPGTANRLSSSLIAQQLIGAGGNTTVLPGIFGTPYEQVKRITNPNLSVYSPITGAIGNVSVNLYNGGSSLGTGDAAIGNWTGVSAGSKAFSFIPATGAAILSPAAGPGTIGFINYHYSINARLGII